MGFLGWMLLAGGVLFLFGAQTGRNPLNVAGKLLRGEPLGEPTMKIGEVTTAAYTPGVVAVGAGLGDGGSVTPLGMGTAGGMVRPIGGPVTSGYGMRAGRMHHGVDIPAATGTPIRAAAAGTVSASGWRGGYGNAVYIDHGGGMQTRYAHQVRQPPVAIGQRVTAGQVIGHVGSTGDSSGPHLHFEVRLNGASQDPLRYISRS